MTASACIHVCAASVIRHSAGTAARAVGPLEAVPNRDNGYL